MLSRCIAIILILGVISNASCKPEFKKKGFPDVINNRSKFDSSLRIGGTGFFVQKPEAYKSNGMFARYQKDESTFLQVSEMLGSNFKEYKERISNSVLVKSDAGVRIFKPLRFNGFSAMYLEGVTPNSSQSQILLFFGDKTFTVVIMCKYKTGDEVSRNELQEMLKSSNYEKPSNIEARPIATYDFDATITGFRQIRSLGNMSLYSDDDHSETGLFDYPNFQILSTTSQSFKALDTLLNTIEQDIAHAGVNFLTNVRKEGEVNGMNVLAYSHEAEDLAGKKGYLVISGMFDPATSTSVILVGRDNSRGNYVRKFEKTIASVKISGLR